MFFKDNRIRLKEQNIVEDGLPHDLDTQYVPRLVEGHHWCAYTETPELVHLEDRKTIQQSN